MNWTSDLSLSFDFLPEVVAVIAVRYEENEINPRINSVLHPSDLSYEEIDIVLGHDADFGDVSVFYPHNIGPEKRSCDTLELRSGVIAENSSGFRSLLGKHATLYSTENDGPVLIVWEGAGSDNPEDARYCNFANRTAQILAGIDRIFSDRWI